MPERPEDFAMIELTHKKYLAIEIKHKLFLAYDPEPISEVFEDDYVKAFIYSLGLKENEEKIEKAGSSTKQMLIRLPTLKDEQPWWAPILVHRIPSELDRDDILVVLKKEPIQINNY